MNHLLKSVFRQIIIRLRGGLGYPNDFYADAIDKQEICPSEMVGGSPTKVLPGQFDRVTGAAFGRSVQGEIAALNGMPRRAKATNIYRFRDVFIMKSWVITGKSFEIFGWPKKEICLTIPKEIDTANLTSSFQGCRYFGHWLRDDCATSILFKDSKDRIKIDKPIWADAIAYEKAFSLPTAELEQNVFIREMYYCDDIYQNSHKAERFHDLRDKIRNRIKSTIKSDVIYIARGPSAKARKFHNELEVIKALEAQGIDSIFAESMPSEQFVSRILDARIIISVEGSQLSHALYALHGRSGGIIAIQPPDRLFTSHLDWARVMGVEFGTVVGIKQGDGFTVPPEDILRTLDLF